MTVYAIYISFSCKVTRCRSVRFSCSGDSDVKARVCKLSDARRSPNKRTDEQTKPAIVTTTTCFSLARSLQEPRNDHGLYGEFPSIQLDAGTRKLEASDRQRSSNDGPIQHRRQLCRTVLPGRRATRRPQDVVGIEARKANVPVRGQLLLRK